MDALRDREGASGELGWCGHRSRYSQEGFTCGKENRQERASVTIPHRSEARATTPFLYIFLRWSLVT